MKFEERIEEIVEGKLLPGVKLLNKKGKVIGVIPFDNEEQFKKYINGFVEKPRIASSSWEEKYIKLKN